MTWILSILDGFGIREPQSDNAITTSHMPYWQHIWSCGLYPKTELQASGEAVGLWNGQMGNSEVGHLTLGLGCAIEQDIVRISKDAQNGFSRLKPMWIDHASRTNRPIHVLTLLSDGGVHAHITHLEFLIQQAFDHSIDLSLHLFLDGRDMPPKSAWPLIHRIQSRCDNRHVKIASIMGRYFAMDRDQRWDRTHQAVQSLLEPSESILPHGIDDQSTAHFIEQALQTRYAQLETDEFIQPFVVYPSPIESHDTVLCMNFRADRMRQLVRYLNDSKDIPAAHRLCPNRLSDGLCLHLYTFTHYECGNKAHVLYPKQDRMKDIGSVFEQMHLSQWRIAETEKYAHVTYFFNGGDHQPRAGEQRWMIPSESVATYDLSPNMKAKDIADRVIEGLQSQCPPDVIICNFANPDMLGHTGHFSATCQSLEHLDEQLGRILRAVQSKPNQHHWFITSDHGNAECMYDPYHQQPHTAHTCSPVPFVYVGSFPVRFRLSGTLADVAPTWLSMMNLPIPQSMTGQSLVERDL